MTGSLVRKELRSLVPFVCLVMFFNLLNWVDIMFTRFPDQFPLHELLDDAAEEQVLTFVLAFALAASLLVREVDEGTLTFLDGLPVSRARVFCTKAALALGVLWLLPLSDLFLRTLLYSWSRTSLETDFLWRPIFTRAFLDATGGFIFLSMGLALSFLRRFSLLVLGLIVCGYLLLQEFQVPFIHLLNIFSLAEPSFRGRTWLLPTTKLFVQLGTGVMCLAIAFGAFELTGDATRRFAERVRKHRWFMLLGAAGTVAAVLVWVGLFAYWGERSGGERKQLVRYANWPTSRARTSRYQFLYPENRAGLVSQVMDRADAVESRVRQFLEAKPILSIVADLTGSAPHTAGLAHWKQVRVDLNAVSEIDELTAVLAHETTHVYMDHESEDKISDDFKSTRFFHEGLATYVEYRLFRPAAQIGRQRRVAAVMHARNQVKFDELVDSDAFARKYDDDLVYPLGEVFVHAMINRYGEAAPGKVLRAFIRPNAPKDLKGAELWRDLLQSWGGNLSEVEDQFYAELDQAAAEYKQFVDSLPRLRGAVQSESRLIVVKGSYEGDAAGTMVCRFRPSADTPDRLYEYAFPEQPGVFRVNKTRYNEATFWYQLGWSIPSVSQPIYEPWVEATLK
jgi:hypothetical protein